METLIITWSFKELLEFTWMAFSIYLPGIVCAAGFWFLLWMIFRIIFRPLFSFMDTFIRWWNAE